MKGLLIYNKEDAERNRDYIKWFIEEGEKRKVLLELIYSQNIFQLGLNEEQLNYDFVLNRSRSYNLALALELNGLKVMNKSQVCLLGNNKLAAYKFAEDLGVASSKILLSWDEEAELISKKIEGHGGQGIKIYEKPYPKFDEAGFQQVLRKDMIGDIRFYIVNNQIIHSVLRRPVEGYISNYSKGGTIELFYPTKEEEDLVEKLISKLHIDYAGIDFLLLKDGSFLFNEIEDVVGSRMLSSLGINNTTKLIYQAILQS